MRWHRPLVAMLILAVSAAGAWFALGQLGVPKLAFTRPWFLLLLSLVPALIWFSYANLAGLGEVRRWLALGLRCAIVTVLILALAGIQLVHEDDTLTVFVLLDRSYSIPQELDAPLDPDTGLKSTKPPKDLRWERTVKALEQATEGRANPRDRIGVIVFGRKPRLEFPASDLPKLNVQELSTAPDRMNTDIAGSIRLGLASFPEGTSRRLLLLSDGNENRGEALKEAEIARLNGVQIDVVPLRYRYQDEITVDRIDAPSETHEDRDLPIRIIVRNHSDRRVRGTLFLRRMSGGEILKAEQKATLEPGLNALQLKWPAGSGSPGTSAFKAFFQPDALAGDRVDNNEAWAHVLVRSDRRRLLVVVPGADSKDHERLVQALGSPRDAADADARSKPIIDVWSADAVPGEKAPRSQELANYDSIILYNIPADLLNRDQQERLRKAVGDQGTGLVVVGGLDSFGAGRWQGEPLEEALPVDTSLRSLKIQAKAGLVLIMHASEMAEGNYWQKEIAKLAIAKLTDSDEVGIIYYGWGGPGASGHVWHVELQPIGPNKTAILRQLETMTPGDMPNFDPALTMARERLLLPEKQLATKHIILISDGDHGLVQDVSLLPKLKEAKISLTTVGVTTHGPAAQAALALVSQATGGRHYPVTDPAQLPGIYIKEMRAMSQNFLYERPFNPAILERGDPLTEWTRAFPRLHGYVRTSRKESPLVQVLMRSTVMEDEPILAQWQYRQGRVVAFTSDAGANEKAWARDWARDEGGLYTDFWTRIVEWSMRTIDDAGLSVETRYENGKGRVTLIDNRDKEARQKKPLRDLRLTVSAAQKPESKSLHLEPISPGVFESSFDAEDSGTYSLTVTETAGQGQEQKTLVRARSALTVPYSQEFATVRSNEGLLEQIAQLTGGRVIDEAALGQADVFRREGLSPIRHLQPIWHWLLFAAACAMLFDVAVRRIAIDFAAVGKKVKGVVALIRRKAAVSEDSQQYLERLKSRKAVVVETLETKRAARRFEAQPGAAPVEETAVATAEPPKPVPAREKPKAAPEPAAGDDFASRLMRAKQKAREQIEGEKKG